MVVVGRARACPQMRALPLHPPCLKHLPFLQRRVTFLLPKPPPQEQLRVKQSLLKTRTPLRYTEVVAVPRHLRYMESHEQGLTAPSLPHLVAGAHVSSRIGEVLRTMD